MDIVKTHITLKLAREAVPGKEVRYADTELQGFQMWVGQRTITYYMRKRHNGKEYTRRIGAWPQMTPIEARTRALALMGALDNHGDIDAGTARAIPTCGEAFDWCLSQQHNPHTIESYGYVFKFAAYMRPMQVDAITRDMIEDFHRKALGLYSNRHANVMVRTIASAVNGMCRKLGLQFRVLIDRFPWAEVTQRTRHLTSDEMPRFFNAIARMRTASPSVSQYLDAILMCLYTGARKSNVCTMLLEEISPDGVWTIPKAKFKGKRDFSTQLGTAEMEIVERNRCGRTSGYVFMHNGRHIDDVYSTLKRVCAAAGIGDIHPHDLRRTLGTWMLSTGAPIAVVSKKLGHASIAITENVYAHLMRDTALAATDTAIGAMRGMNKS